MALQNCVPSSTASDFNFPCPWNPYAACLVRENWFSPSTITPELYAHDEIIDASNNVIIFLFIKNILLAFLK